MAFYAHENKIFHNNDIETILKNIVDNDFFDILPQANKVFVLWPQSQQQQI